MRRSILEDWLRYGAITGLVFAAGAGLAAMHFGAAGPRIGLASAGGFAFGATIEWITLRFQTPATAFAVILTIAFVGTLQAYAPAQDDIGIAQDFRSLGAALTDPDTAGEGALSGASVRRNVEAAAADAAQRAGIRATQEAASRPPSRFRSIMTKGVSRTGGAGAP